ncbi:MAG: rhomboid family intramembrane serine protease [Flavobacteriales bacterium]
MMRGYGSGMHLGFLPVITNLILINVLVHVLRSTLMPDLAEQFGLYAIGSPNFRPWQLVTHMFLHADIGHLFGNMFGLFMFGTSLEHLWGPKRFLSYYLLTGLGAAALQLGVNAWEHHAHMEVLAAYGISEADVRGLSVPGITDADWRAGLMALYEKAGVRDQLQADILGDQVLAAVGDLVGKMIGASGAVFGVLIGFGMMLPNEIIYAPGLLIPLKAKYVVALYGIIELLQGVHPMSGDSVAHYAHLGGLIFGFFIVRHWKRTTIL